MQAQPTWSRATKWRQGSVLPAEATERFGFSSAEDSESVCVAVISHDCDLANDNLTAEPDVEVVVGRVVSKQDGNFTWGKAPRTLHYEATRDGAAVFIELVSTSKRLVSKDSLASFSPDPAFGLDGKALAVLRSWLGSRYNRGAFPDSFVNRMKDLKADTKLARALASHGALISCVYFDVDEGSNVELTKGSPHELSVLLVFAPGDDAAASADAADELAREIETGLHTRLQDHPMEIILKSCFSISEDDLPVSRARVLSQWRLEYMTLKADGELRPPDL